MNSPNASLDTSSSAGKYNILPLVIKRYETPRGFSKFLHDALPDSSSSTEVLLEGPFVRNKIQKHYFYYFFHNKTIFILFFLWRKYKLGKFLIQIYLLLGKRT